VVTEIVAPDDLAAGVATFAGSDGWEEQGQWLGGHECLLRNHTRPAPGKAQHVKTDDSMAVVGGNAVENPLNGNADDRPPELPSVRPDKPRLAHGLFPRSKAGARRGAE